MHCAQACPGAIMLMPARVAAATVERRVILLACALSLARRAAREQDADAPKPKISDDSPAGLAKCDVRVIVRLTGGGYRAPRDLPRRRCRCGTFLRQLAFTGPSRALPWKGHRRSKGFSVARNHHRHDGIGDRAAGESGVRADGAAVAARAGPGTRTRGG